MNIICDKTLLSAAIDGVSKAVTLRSTIPVLEGILLKAEGFQLTLTGYDLEMGIVTTIEANVKEPGEIVLNAKLLSSMISRMPSGQITIQSADNGKTTIQSGVAQFEIQSMPATDFPDLPNTCAQRAGRHLDLCPGGRHGSGTAGMGDKSKHSAGRDFTTADRRKQNKLPAVFCR